MTSRCRTARPRRPTPDRRDVRVLLTGGPRSTGSHTADQLTTQDHDVVVLLAATHRTGVEHLAVASSIYGEGR